MNAPVKQQSMAMRLFSTLMDRAKFLNRAGLSFEGKRDYYGIFGYAKAPTFDMFLDKYKRQDIANRIIKEPVDATWSEPPEFEDAPNEFKKGWDDLVERLNVWSHLAKVDEFAGIGRYAIVLIGLDDSLKLDSPVRKGRKNEVMYLQPYMEGSVKITKWQDDPTQSDFGKPLEYQVNPGELEVTSNIAGIPSPSKILQRSSFVVHASRVLHVADNTLESPIIGTSRLEPIYNLLDDILKVAGGSAETFWLTGNRGMQIDVDKDMELNEEDANDLADEVDEFVHGLRRVVRTRGTKVNPLGSDMADPRGVFNVLLALLAAQTGIPQRILTGTEAGQLASQQDRANWAEKVAQRISRFAEPIVLRPFCSKLMTMGVLPEEKGLKLTWPDAYKMSPLERAQTSAQMARSMANVTKALDTSRNAVEETVFTPEEARKVVGFGKHAPTFGPKPEGTMLKPKPEPVATGPFGKPVTGPTPPTAKQPASTPTGGKK